MQALRAVAALLVVLFHLRTGELKYLAGPAVLEDLARHASAGVDLFFIISGFVMTTLAAGRYTSPGAGLNFLMKRVWRVVPLYWLFTTTVVVLMAVAPSIINSTYAEQSYALSYFLVPHAQMPLLSVGWTLEHEAYFYLVFAAFLAIVPERFVSHGLTAWAALIGLASLWHDTDATPVHILVTSPLTIEFIAGALIGLHWRRIPPPLAVPLLAAGVGMYVCAATLLPTTGLETLNEWHRVAIFGSCMLLVFTGLVSLEGFDRLSVPAWLTRLGDSSYSIYLSHMFVIAVVGRAWAWWVPVSGSVSHLIFVAATVLACCVVGNAVHRWVERPLLEMPSRLRARHRAY